MTHSRYGHMDKRRLSTPARSNPISQLPTSKTSDQAELPWHHFDRLCGLKSEINTSWSGYVTVEILRYFDTERCPLILQQLTLLASFMSTRTEIYCPPSSPYLTSPEVWLWDLFKRRIFSWYHTEISTGSTEIIKHKVHNVSYLRICEKINQIQELCTILSSAT